MKFDSAIAAHRAFKRAQENGNLGDDLENAIEAEDLFSSELGDWKRQRPFEETLEKNGLEDQQTIVQKPHGG